MTSERAISIAIIGGGIGGLAAAASLLRAGFDVQVYEQAKALGEVGAGINIGPNASRILNRFGIAEQLARNGVRPQTFDQRRWDDGRYLLRSPLGDAVETTFHAPYYTLHRGDLHRAIAAAVPADRATEPIRSIHCPHYVSLQWNATVPSRCKIRVWTSRPGGGPPGQPCFSRT